MLWDEKHCLTQLIIDFKNPITKQFMKCDNKLYNNNELHSNNKLHSKVTEKISMVKSTLSPHFEYNNFSSVPLTHFSLGFQNHKVMII